jgi:hypothetical protein
MEKDRRKQKWEAMRRREENENLLTKNRCSWLSRANRDLGMSRGPGPHLPAPLHNFHVLLQLPLCFLPTQDAQHQVEDEEGSEQNEGDEIDPGPLIPNGIIDLVQTKV